MPAGVVVVLNGVPRSGKSSIAAALVQADDRWVNRGVDAVLADTDPSLLPGIGLRPGGERPDLEDLVRASYCRLFDDVAALARAGQHVAMDVGLHDDYTRPLDIMGELTDRLRGLDVCVVGVRCPLSALRKRRRQTGYLSWDVGQAVPEPVLRWERAVHGSRDYDLEVDTAELTPEQAALAIRSHLATRVG